MPEKAVPKSILSSLLSVLKSGLCCQVGYSYIGLPKEIFASLSHLKTFLTFNYFPVYVCASAHTYTDEPRAFSNSHSWGIYIVYKSQQIYVAYLANICRFLSCMSGCSAVWSTANSWMEASMMWTWQRPTVKLTKCHEQVSQPKLPQMTVTQVTVKVLCKYSA